MPKKSSLLDEIAAAPRTSRVYCQTCRMRETHPELFAEIEAVKEAWKAGKIDRSLAVVHAVCQKRGYPFRHGALRTHFETH